ELLGLRGTLALDEVEPDRAARLGELDGVGEQIDEDLQRALAIADEAHVAWQVRGHDEREAARLRLRLREHDGGIDHLRDDDGHALDREATRVDLGEVEDLADEAEQMAPTRDDAPDLLPLCG